MAARPASRAATAIAVVFGVAGAAQAADPAPPTIVAPAAFKSAIEAERGRTLLVNLWASWCAPCLREVPELLRLEAAYANCGLRVLGLALDEPTELTTAVQPAITRYFPAYRTLARDGSSMDSFASVLDGAWNEVMPTSYIVAPDGRVAKRIQGGKSYAEFEAAVKPLLDCPAGWQQPCCPA